MTAEAPKSQGASDAQGMAKGMAKGREVTLARRRVRSRA